MLIQGYDFLNMYRKMNCVMQVEGSDQWGNITTGIDLIRKIDGKEAYAFTMPLILDSNGKKFGKSEGNALWLDKDKTSSYALYQYLINTDDAKVLEYLKVFTFLTPEEILDVMDRHNKEPHLRIAQETLAKCIITDLRGEEEYTKARDISKALFSEDIKNLSSEDIVNSLSGVKNVLVYEGNIVDVLVDSKVFSSKREARELITGNALSINNKKVNDVNYIISKNDLIDNKIVVIKKGKKNYFIGKFNQYILMVYFFIFYIIKVQQEQTFSFRFIFINMIFCGTIYMEYELQVHKQKEGYFMLGNNMLFTQNKQNGGGIFTTK